MIGALVVLLSILGVKAFGHSKRSTEEKVKHITEKMTHKLNLNEAQSAAVYEINLKRHQGHLKAYEAGRDKEILKAAVAQWEEEMKSVLNAEQQKKLGL